MRSTTRAVAIAGLLLPTWVGTAVVAGAEPRSVRLAATLGPELDLWDNRVDAMLRAGDLRVQQARADTLIEARTHVRLAQFHKGVPVFGGELVRQSDLGGSVSLFGTVYEDIDLDVTPRLSAEQAAASVGRATGLPPPLSRPPELVVLPRDGNDYLLTYRVRAFTGTDIVVYFVDAKSGDVVWQYSDLQTQSSVGAATGVLNDQKKISARSATGNFLADDRLRPPTILTYDMKGDIFRTVDALNGVISLADRDLASDTDNTWTDGANVDAHVYAGYVYDYYFKRFGRRGLDNANIPIKSVVHPVRREDQGRYTAQIVDLFYYNAAYIGDGIMLYGEGSAVRSFGQLWNFVAGGLDVVAHELTHGVTDYSSRLIYNGESGALNESFSDMMGVSVEFFFQPAGNGSLLADYLLGEDVIVPGGIRSMQNPGLFGHPDHYSIRFTGSQDGGGVHINSGIPNHVFYLAIEGGTNRVSGLAVQGVGAANREQIEKVFYRAFTSMLPASANFSTARAATIQSARDLYQAGSPAERAVIQAWTAVGVN